MRSSKLIKPRCVRYLAAAVVLVVLAPLPAQAGNFKNSGAPISALSNMNPGTGGANPGTNVSYTFTLYAATTGTSIKRFEFQTQTSASVDALPTGMSLTSAGGGTTTGLGGQNFAYDSGNSTPASGLVKYTNATGSTPTNPITIKLTGFTNPTAAGTYYFQVRTYDATTAGTLIDQDIIGFTIGNQSVALSTSIGGVLSFAIDSISAPLSPALSPSGVSTATTNLTVVTNASNGYQVYAGAGSSLSNGAQTIPFIASGAVTAGTSRYGLRVTTCPSGATCPFNGTNNTDTGYATQTSIFSRTNGTGSDAATVTYRAAVSNVQASGAYSSTVNYVATGQF